MRDAFHQLYYHVVWTTKGRSPDLAGPVRSAALEAISDKCRRLKSILHAVNAVEDHVHLALEVPPTLAISTAVGQIKGASSHDTNATIGAALHWQDGYAAVTFRKGELEEVMEYIATQEERHRKGRLSAVLENCGADQPEAATAGGGCRA